MPSPRSTFRAGGRPTLWRCRECRREFANRNRSHACGHYKLADHFRGKPPEIRALYNQVVAALRAIGPVRIPPEKTRIAFQVRGSFAQVTPRQKWLDGHVVLARRLEHPRFRRIETISPRNHVRVFRLSQLPALELLRTHLEQGKDTHALQLLDRLVADVPIKPNPRAIPSLWYMPLVGSGNFFDGFGFADYGERFSWANIAMDERERLQPPQNPLLPFLERLTHELPQRWDNRLKKYVPNDDWLLWELDEPKL